MLLHLPIVFLATLSPIPVSDTVPKFDVAKECRFEGESTVDFNRCRKDESDALAELTMSWSQQAAADRNACQAEATVGGFASYVDLLTCLEMAHEANNSGDAHPRAPQPAAAMRLSAPGVTVGVGHDPIIPAQLPGRPSP